MVLSILIMNNILGEKVREFQIFIEHINTKHMVVDPNRLTKRLPPNVFKKHVINMKCPKILVLMDCDVYITMNYGLIIC